MRVKPKIEVEVIKEPHGPHDLGVTRRINPKKRVKTKIEKAAQKVVVYPKIIPKRNQKHRDFTQKVYREGNGKGGNPKYKVADKFKELRTLLSNLKYKVETKGLPRNKLISFIN